MIKDSETVKAILGTVNLKGKTAAYKLWDTVADRIALQELIDAGYLALTGNLTTGQIKMTDAGRTLAAELWA
jgi:hypothetical protein